MTSSYSSRFLRASKCRSSTFFWARFDPPADHAAFDPLALFHAERFQDRLDPGTGEDPHQVVFERQVEPAAAGIALAAAAAAKLQIDAAGVVPLGADDVQAAQFLDLNPSAFMFSRGFDLVDQGVPFFAGERRAASVLVLQFGPGHRFGIAAQNDVGTAAGHVGGDGDGTEPARLGDNFRLALVVLGVEHLMLDAARRAAPQAVRSFRWRRCPPAPGGPCAEYGWRSWPGDDVRAACFRRLNSTASSVSLWITPTSSFSPLRSSACPT
jgi:hypothetical protein